MSDPPGDEGQGPAVKDRWWVDFGDKKGEQPRPRPQAPVGERFFRSGTGFDQETARARLTDLNLKLLIEANPAEGGWGYVQLAEKPFPSGERERIQSLIPVPAYARAALIDSGRSVRILFTGTPVGERVLELSLAETPSFDCWVHGEWVREASFRNRKEAIAALRRYVEEFLSPEGIAAWEAMRAQA